MKHITTLYHTWRACQPLNETLQRRMDQQFMFDFNYNSNHMEGNTLTYGQTKMLLLFGRVEGSALMRDYEEMKAHNVGLEMTKREAVDKRPLSENFIRELNRTILVDDFYKLSNDRSYRYKIHTGVYKTRPNSVITPSGEMFDYASPEETPAMMGELVAWYNSVAQSLHPIEQAAVFHYRYIRIHPFEDGNGRIARLLMNYILLRNGYPMFVIPTTDRDNYLTVLGQCDKITGTLPFDGANATAEQIKPFVDYITKFIEKKLTLAIQFAKEEITSFSEINDPDDDPDKNIDNQRDNKIKQKNVPDNDPDNFVKNRQKMIVKFIKMNNKISTTEIAELLKVTSKTIKRDLQKLKERGIIERKGSEKGGYWEILS